PGAIVSQVTYAYDLAGQLIQSFDGLGDETDYTYDAAGDQTGVTVRAPRGPGNTPGAIVSQVTNVYDLAGQLTQSFDGDNNETDYGYDAAGDQTSVIVRAPRGPGNAPGAIVSQVTYAYDLAG